MNESTKLKIPYNAKQVGHCYERLKEVLPVYQKGISDIRDEMESPHPFDQRLEKLLNLHAAVLEAGQSLETTHTWNEEDIYLCCLYDMLEAMYANEAEKIVHGEGTAKEKKKNLDQLAHSITKLPFGSPQYRTGILPRLEAVISRSSNQLELTY